MSRYKCHKCESEHGEDNMVAYCAYCYANRQHTEPKKDRDFLLVCAVRYCLGRSSYIVSTMTDYLIKHAKEISLADLRVIANDIDEQKDYGASIDKHEWMRARAAIAEALKP